MFVQKLTFRLGYRSCGPVILPPKKPGAGRGRSTPTVSGSEFGPKIKTNVSSLQRRAVEGGTAIEQEEEGDEDEEGYFDGLIGKRGADLSGQTLKGDHALRSLWVNDRGNMWVFWIRRN